MRATLLTAQRMADSIVKEAEEKRDGILRQAESAAREKLEDYRREAEQCSRRLQQGQEEIQRFVAESRALCEKELRFLEEFPSLPVEEGAGKGKAAEESVLSAGEPAPAVPEPAPQEETPAPQAAPAAQSVPAAETLLDALAAAEEAGTEDLSATRRVNISELKFGPNYRGGGD